MRYSFSWLPVVFVTTVFVFIFSLFPVRSPVHAWTLPDTGQTTCYDASGNTIACPAAGDALAQDGTYVGSQPHFYDNGDETVTDLNTDLVWQKADDGTMRNWTDAGTYCDGLVLAGQSDWRLPTIEELGVLVNAETFALACYSAFSCKNGYYWSSSSYAVGAAEAWCVLFSNGYAGNRDKTNAYYVRCVRGGP